MTAYNLFVKGDVWLRYFTNSANIAAGRMITLFVPYFHRSFKFWGHQSAKDLSEEVF